MHPGETLAHEEEAGQGQKVGVRMSPAALLVLSLLLVAAPYALIRLMRQPRRLWIRRLRALSERLEGGTFRNEGGPQLAAPTARGRLGGREVRITVTEGEFGVMLCYDVAIGPTPRSGSLNRAQLTALLSGTARPGEQAREVHAALDTLFGLMGAKVASIGDGWLRVEREVTDYALSPPSLDRALRQMLQVAALWDSNEVSTARLGIRLAWTGGEGRTLCPYCRDALDPDEAAGCDSCRTLHHTECLTEAGGCTIYGCRGGQPESAVRA